MSSISSLKRAKSLFIKVIITFFVASMLYGCNSSSTSSTQTTDSPLISTITAQTQTAIQAAPYIANLGSDDWNTQNDAVNDVAGMGSKVIDLLVAEFKNEDPNIRTGAISALGKIDDPKVVEILILALEDTDEGVRYTAAQDLGQYKDKRAVEPLIQALEQDSDDGVRFSAALSLGQIKDKKAVNALIVALKDDNDTVRLYSAMSLSEIGGFKAKSALLKIKDLQTIAAIHYFYIKKGGSAYEPLLIQALEQYGNQSMLDDYLNCGNSRLESAALSYAQSHGYTIQYYPIN